MALDGEGDVHVYDEAFVFKANELAAVQRRRSAKAEVDGSDRGLWRREIDRRRDRSNREGGVSGHLAFRFPNRYVLSRCKRRLDFAPRFHLQHE